MIIIHAIHADVNCKFFYDAKDQFVDVNSSNDMITLEVFSSIVIIETRVIQ